MEKKTPQKAARTVTPKMAMEHAILALESEPGIAHAWVVIMDFESVAGERSLRLHTKDSQPDWLTSALFSEAAEWPMEEEDDDE